MVRRACLVLAAVLGLSLIAGPVRAEPRWVRHIGRIVGAHPMSVVVGDPGSVWYRHRASVARPPASNEKLLLSMALLERFGGAHTLALRALGPAGGGGGAGRRQPYLQGQGDPGRG